MQTKKRKAVQSAVALGMSLLMLSTPGIARADEPAPPPADTVTEIERVAGDLIQPTAESTMITSDGTVSVDSGVEVSIPADADVPVTVSDQNGVAPSVEIELPDLGGTGESDVTSAGVSVFDGDDATLVVQPVDGGGVQAVVRLENADAPTVLPFAVDAGAGSRMTVNSAGGVDVVDAAGTPVGDFAPPWAIDAKGNMVPTRFELTADGQLVQIVETNADTAFPVVADPCWTCGAKIAWKIAKCAAVIAASTVAAVKLYRALRALKAGLTMGELASLLVKATFPREKVLALAAAITGVDVILAACKP